MCFTLHCLLGWCEIIFDTNLDLLNLIPVVVTTLNNFAFINFIVARTNFCEFQVKEITER